MIRAERFIYSQHIDQVNEWAKQREIVPTEKDLLPELGRIVEGLAALFLYRTDSKIAFMENLITNKDAKPDDVKRAVYLCIRALQNDAQDEGFTHLRAVTYNFGVVETAKKNGFLVVQRGCTMIAKELK